jgi:hypothetical protein
MRKVPRNTINNQNKTNAEQTKKDTPCQKRIDEISHEKRHEKKKQNKKTYYTILYNTKGYS